MRKAQEKKEKKNAVPNANEITLQPFVLAPPIVEKKGRYGRERGLR